MKHQKNNIDFLGIGAQKAGTNWLYKNLKQLEEFSLTPIKEMHYFDRSPDYPSPNILSETLLINRILKEKYLLDAIQKIGYTVKQQNWELFGFYLKWYLLNYSDNWYLSLFQGFKGYTGEITPSYSILNKDDIRRIYKLIPNVKLVLILRNPIHRAWSHYRFSTKKIPNHNFENVTTDEIIKFMDSKDQSLRSDYIRTLDNYSSVFNSEQILIGFYDAIIDNPEALFNDILKHICGDKTISFSHLNLKNEVHKSISIKCPTEIEGYLKNRYHDQIKELSERYGGYFTKWYVESYEGKSMNKNSTLLPTMYMKS